MKRREFLKAGFAAAAGLTYLPTLLPAASATKNNAPKKPNIIFIMADDHAANAIGCYATLLKDYAKTPNIDRIAREGAKLNNCFCTNSICTPSRAVILTGQYSHINSVYTLDNHFNAQQEHLAKILQRLGYQTAIVGKWHLHETPTGFDYYNYLVNVGEQGTYFAPEMLEKGRKKKTVKGFSTDIITDSCLNWLKTTDKTRPFFLMCHYKAVHGPFKCAKRFDNLYKDVTIPQPDNFWDDYKNRSKSAAMRKGMMAVNRSEEYYQKYLKSYLRCVAGIDENVGRILGYLDTNNLADDTVIVYTSDQGMFLGEHGWDDKRFFYEESIKMPFVIRYPRKIKPALVNNDIIINAAFAPTFLDYAGVPTPPFMQGQSFAANLQGKTPPDWRQSMYYRYWMHLAHLNTPAHYGVRTKRYKLIFYYGLPLGMAGAVNKPTEPEWELFDLQKDPSEMNSIYNDPAYKKITDELKKELLRLKKYYHDTDEIYPELMKVRKKCWPAQDPAK